MTLAYHQNSDALHTVLSQIKQIKSYDIYGYVYGITGGIVLASGLKGLVVYGGVCFIKTADNKDIYGEVVGFEGEMTKILVSSAIGHIKIGLKVYIQNKNDIYPCDAWLGNVIDAFGNINQDGIISPLPFGDTAYPLRGTPPLAAQRRGFGGRLETQNPIFNSFLPICNGQRVGLFAGSGVGKSTLMSFFAKNIDADVVVIGLIGERGREVNDFVHKTLTPQMRDKCIIIAVSSDEAALIKRRGAYMTLAVAEYFRDKGKNVVLMFDSLTRLAEAQREIGLMSGEPPAMRAFPPSAFSEVMALCERSGPGCNNTTQGNITAFFTVLVQGGDMDEPVADCVRGTLDGHIVLEREIAERGLYPAVNILKSISRSLPDCASADENNILQKTKRLLSEYKDVEPMVKLGVYKKGFAPQTDRAVDLYPTLEDFLYQSNVTMNTADTFSNLEQIITA